MWQLAASFGPLTYHHLQAGGHIANTLQNFVLWATFSDEILMDDLIIIYLHHWASTQTWNIDVLAVLSSDC